MLAKFVLLTLFIKAQVCDKSFWVERNMLLSFDWAVLFLSPFMKHIPSLTNYLLKNNQDVLKYSSCQKQSKDFLLVLVLVVILKAQNKFSLLCSKCTLINIVCCIFICRFWIVFWNLQWGDAVWKVLEKKKRLMKSFASRELNQQVPHWRKQAPELSWAGSKAHPPLLVQLAFACGQCCNIEQRRICLRKVIWPTLRRPFLLPLV